MSFLRLVKEKRGIPFNWTLLSEIDVHNLENKANQELFWSFVDVFPSMSVETTDMDRTLHPLMLRLIKIMQIAIRSFDSDLYHKQCVIEELESMNKELLDDLRQMKENEEDEILVKIQCPVCKHRSKSVRSLDVHVFSSHTEIFEDWRRIRNYQHTKRPKLVNKSSQTTQKPQKTTYDNLKSESAPERIQRPRKHKQKMSSVCIQPKYAPNPKESYENCTPLSSGFNQDTDTSSDYESERRPISTISDSHFENTRTWLKSQLENTIPTPLPLESKTKTWDPRSRLEQQITSSRHR